MSDLESEIWDREYPTEEELLSSTQDIYEDDSDMYEDDSDMYEEDEDDMYEEQDDEFFEDFIEEYAAEEQEESLMDKAHVRLEKGRLYNLLIKHNLFDGVDADTTAVTEVQKEIKGFILERLEILLGMRAEKTTEVERVIQESQFNDAEVEALRMVASRVTRGASENAPKTERKVEEKSELNTVKQKPKVNGLNALGKKPVKAKPAPKQVKRKLKSKVAKPKAKTQQKPARKIKKEMAQVSTDNMTITDVAKRDINYIENLGKARSVEEANAIVAQRHNRPKPKNTINQDAVNSHYRTKVSTSEGQLSDLGKLMRMAAMNEAKKR